MSGLFTAQNEQAAETFAQEGEKLYTDVEGGSTATGSTGQQGTAAGGGNYQQDMTDAETALKDGETLYSGVSKDI